MIVKVGAARERLDLQNLRLCWFVSGLTVNPGVTLFSKLITYSEMFILKVNSQQYCPRFN